MLFRGKEWTPVPEGHLLAEKRDSVAVVNSTETDHGDQTFIAAGTRSGAEGDQLSEKGGHLQRWDPKRPQQKC